MSPYGFDPGDVPYTKCGECGVWDEHAPDCITGARQDYIEGRIEVDELERRLNAIML